MTIRNVANQQCHDEMIERLAGDIRKKGYQNVKISHPGQAGESRPENIYSEPAEMFFSPDIYAEKAGIAYLFEVETGDSINSSLTKIELETFAKYSQKHGAYFYLVVPKSIQEEARAVLETIEVRNKRMSFVLPV